jgi:hypothetical protein
MPLPFYGRDIRTVLPFNDKSIEFNQYVVFFLFSDFAAIIFIAD